MLERHHLDSHILGERRPYRVLLPPAYRAATEERYPVLYLHDGQAVFDDDTAVLARLNDRVWPALDVDARKTLALMRSGAVQPAILVAVDALSLETRIRDYLPPGDAYLGIAGRADRYAEFLLEELKPAIDFMLRTKIDRTATATAGFSLGGLVAFYLAGAYPEHIGAAGSISGAFWASPRMVLATRERPRTRLYLDSGDDNFADSWTLCRRLEAAGYRRGVDLVYHHRAGHGHEPADFAAALAPMLSFLLPPASGSDRSP